MSAAALLYETFRQSCGTFFIKEMFLFFLKSKKALIFRAVARRMRGQMLSVRCRCCCKLPNRSQRFVRVKKKVLFSCREHLKSSFIDSIRQQGVPLNLYSHVREYSSQSPAAVFQSDMGELFRVGHFIKRISEPLSVKKKK